MGKAILVIDMPEQVCQKCKLCFEVCIDIYMCAATGREIPDGEIPAWCPLKEVPEKKSEFSAQNDYLLYSAKGWNACIDKISKE